MIELSRLNGERILINPELLERAEETPDTVVTLANGSRYVVAESLDQLMSTVERYRARILARSLVLDLVGEAGAAG
ncbi:MAG TPA: flagellar FlbD family protein [Acidimicrobiales bacterium]|nr:flagellar FlbD family protein [Acidimicrobiales bacterium]